MDRSKWEYKKLSDVSNIIMGQSPSSESYNEDGKGLPFYQGNADFGELNPTARVYCDAPSREAGPDDILMSVRAPIGAINIANEHCCIGRGLCAIRPIPKVSDKMFLFYFLRAKNVFLNSQGTGSTFKSISKKVVYDLDIPMPSFADQQRIVAELDCLNEMIAVKQEQLKEFDKLAQSIFYDMFGDLSINKKGWQKKPFTEIAVAKTGITYKPDNVKDSGIIVLRSSNVQNDELAFEDVVRVDLPISEKYHIQNGDILMCSRNGSARLVGKTARIKNVNEIMTWGAFMTIIRSQYNDFLLHYFKTDTFRDSLSSSKTTTVHQITIGMLNALSIPLPPLTLQQQFAEKISSIEAQKELVKQSIAETQSLFNSRMDFYFN